MYCSVSYYYFATAAKIYIFYQLRITTIMTSSGTALSNCSDTDTCCTIADDSIMKENTELMPFFFCIFANR